MESEQKARCTGCREAVGEAEFKNHVRSCTRYEGIAIKTVRSFTKSENPIILKFFSAQLEVCVQIIKDLIKKSELEALLQYNKVLEEKMAAMKNMKGTIDDLIAMHNLGDVLDDFSAFNHHTAPRKNPSHEQIKYPLLQPSREIVTCKICNKKLDAITESKSIFTNQECFHKFCVPCLTKYIDQQIVSHFGNLSCPIKDCKKSINQFQIKQLAGDKKYHAYEEAYNNQLRRKMNLKKCCVCKFEFEFVEGNLNEAPMFTVEGEPISLENRILYSKNRFVCPNQRCKKIQCKQCFATPFHTGLSCKQYKTRKQIMSEIILKYRNCRYCTKELTIQNYSNSSHKALADICNATKCQAQAKSACNKIFNCGHPCLGSKNDTTCLPCMNQACCKDKADMASQKSKDYCRLCFTQMLMTSPCVRSNCGHIFHEKCMISKFETRWKTPRIMFNFCKCPVCKKFLSLPKQSQTQLAKLMRNCLYLFVKIQSSAIERLKFEGANRDVKLQDPKSPFYQKQYEYSMAIYSYYQCFKCKKPYYGGRRNCNQIDEPQLLTNYKMEDLVCPECCSLKSENCATHGKTYVDFKCKYCCSTAPWFWNGTHYCQPCYKVREYVSKLDTDSLTKCLGPEKCPIGGNHGGNGMEKSLPCSYCKNLDPRGSGLNFSGHK